MLNGDRFNVWSFGRAVAFHLDCYKRINACGNWHWALAQLLSENQPRRTFLCRKIKEHILRKIRARKTKSSSCVVENVCWTKCLVCASYCAYTLHLAYRWFKMISRQFVCSDWSRLEHNIAKIATRHVITSCISALALC